MTIVYVDCDYCDTHPVKLQPDELRLFLNHPSGGGSYWFEHCGQSQQRPANSRTVSVLLAAGVPYENAYTERQLRASDYQTIVLSKLAMRSVDTIADIGWETA